MRELSRTRILRSLLLFGLGAVAACSSPSGGEGNVGTTSTTESLTAVPAVSPSWANKANFVGRLDAAAPVSLQVHLAMHNLADAQATLAAISDPDNALYGKFLSDEEFAAKYAPTADDVSAVAAHLAKSGLRVTYTPENNAFLTVEGTSAQVEHAFATRLGQYKVEGATMRATMDTPKLPASVGSRVSVVLGLATPATMKSMRLSASDLHRKGAAATPSDTVPATTCSEYFGQVTDTEDPPFGDYPSPMPYAGCGLKPAQIRAAYGLAAEIRKGNDGHGQKIAIVDAYTSPTLVKDAQTYFANQDADYPLATSQITLYQGPGTAGTPDTGWYGEQSLDVEAVHAIAPGAHINYVGAQSPMDVDLIGAINMILTRKLATLISNSYGGPEAGSAATPWQAIAVQAGLKGVGLYFASGDSGDNAGSAGFPTPNFPASLAEVTAVGGTSLALDATGARVFELGWETGASFLNPAVPADDAGDPATPATWSPAAPGFFAFGAGGGMSEIYLQPSWQKGIVPKSLSTNVTVQDRVIPDVAMVADPMTGYLVGMSDPTTGVYSESVIGGTSLATPLYTATVALAQQNAGRTFGFANPLFYKASKKSAFTDIVPAATPQAVAIPGQGGIATDFDYHGQPDNTLATAKGFDDVTGIGVPNGAKFFSSVK